MSISFCWDSPTHGDGRYTASPHNCYVVTPEYTVQNARLAEAAGFEGILVPAGPSCTDAFITAAHIATATSTIRPLVAVRPGPFRPISVAKMAATLDQICKGRLSLNIVTGLRITLLVAHTDAAAWQRTDELISRISSAASDKVKKYIRDPHSIVLGRLKSLAGKTTSNPCFWTGMVPYRTGNSTVLVGSYDSVANSLARYARAGISEFIFSSYPHIKTVSELGNKMLPRVRALIDGPSKT